MGGILILGTIILSTLLWAKWDNIMVWIVLFTTIGLGALGFRDDYLKISKKNSKGVSARTKLVWQTSVAVIAGFAFLLTAAALGLAVRMAVLYLLAGNKASLADVAKGGA